MFLHVSCTSTGFMVQSYISLWSIWLQIGVTMYMDMAMWSRMTARPGDPPQGQVQSMWHQYET